MNHEWMPAFFEENFDRFSQLKTDGERALFWKKLAENELCSRPAFKDDFNAALSMLSSKLEDMEKRARERLTV